MSAAYRVERTIDEGATWESLLDGDDSTTAWAAYIDLSETERVRLVKNDRVISTSHVDDALAVGI